jgi:hypothetical protein
MRADMAAGTPGPWRESERWSPPIGHGPHETDANGNIFWGCSITGSNEHGGMIYPTLAAVHNFPDNIYANARRIARVPDMEAEILRRIEREALLRTALEYIMDGYGLNAPDFRQTETDEDGETVADDWIISTARAALNGGAE